jgi:hypothetical protein
MKKIFCLFLVVLFGLGVVKPVLAAGPMINFSPSSGTYTKGDTFKVTIKVNSGIEKSQAVDAWATFDKEKLEVVSIEKAASPAFSFSLGQNFYNDTGKFNATCSSLDLSSFTATVLNGDLVVITLKAKAVGTAKVDFVCQAGVTTDSNVFNVDFADVIDCASNVNGVYTITEGGGSDPDPTAIPTITGTELPKTGVIGGTLGLIIFGIVGVLSSLALRFL